MIKKTIQLLAYYLPSKMTRETKELFLYVIILDMASAMMLIFEPVYLYTLGFSLFEIVLYYFFVYLAYFFLLPFGAKIAKREGFEHGMLYASITLIFYYGFLYLTKSNIDLIFVAGGLLAIYKTLYWPSFHSDIALYGKGENRGKELSSLIIFDTISAIGGPALGGVILALGGFPMLFVVVSCFVLLANIPLQSTKEKFVPGNFSYPEAFRNFFSREKRRNFVAYLGFGEELVVLTLWPVFMFTVAGSFANLGALVSLSTFIMVVALLAAGRAFDSGKRRHNLVVGNAGNMIAWCMRLVFSGIVGIFAADALSRTSKSVLTVGLYGQTYDDAKDHHLVSGILFFEMCLVLGKLLAAAVLLIVFYFYGASFFAAWIIALMFSLFYFLYRPASV